MKKNIFIAIIFCLIGGVLASLILIPQIKNRYEMGYNNGYTTGKFEVMNFLKENVKNTQFTSEEIKAYYQYLSVKYASISVVEINGVKTIIVEE